MDLSRPLARSVRTVVPAIFLPFFLLFLAVTSSTATAQEPFTANFGLDEGTFESMWESGKRFAQERRDPNVSIATASSPIEMSVPIRGGHEVRIKFLPHTILSPELFLSANGAEESEAFHFVGDVEGGRPGSFARLSVFDGNVTGLLRWIDEEGDATDYAIETSSRYYQQSFLSARPELDLVVSDVSQDGIGDLTGACGVQIPHGIAAVGAGSHQGGDLEFAEALPANGRTLQIATDADYQFHQRYGANANSEIQALLNIVDGIYQQELSIAVEITHQHVWTTSNDPYTESLPGYDTILRDFTQRNQLPVADHKHLFSARDIPGSVIGVAWLSGVCNPSINTGVTSISNAGTFYTRGVLAVIFAHEVGHNLGASHTVESPSPCDPTDVMCWAVQQNATRFLSKGRNEISNYLASGGSCLNDGGGDDPPLPSAYSISGLVRTAATGGGLAGVTVTLSGPTTRTATTNILGAYGFDDLAPGSYTVSVQKQNWSFTPQSRSVFVNTSNVSQVDFTGSESGPSTYSISGSIVDGSGAPATRITVRITGGTLQGGSSASTNMSGAYTFENLTPGTYTLTPERLNWSFTPPSRVVTIGDSNMPNINFTGQSSGANPLRITVSPGQQNVAVGQQATITASATGGVGALSYQWYSLTGNTATAIAGATGTSYSMRPLPEHVGTFQRFQVEVRDQSNNTLRSAVASINTTGAPYIITQPQDQNVSPGTRVQFSVQARGDSTLTFRWFVNGAAAGTNSPTLRMNEVSTADNGKQISVQVVDAQGDVTNSRTATLQVQATGDLPKINRHPKSVSKKAGQKVTLKVVAVNSARMKTTTGMTYQWKRDGVAIPGETRATLKLGKISPSMAGTYTVVVTNNQGNSLESNPAQVQVIEPRGTVKLKLRPKRPTGKVGQKRRLVGVVKAPRAFRRSTEANYRWFINGLEQPGVTGRRLLLSIEESHHDASIHYTFTDALGAVHQSPAVTFKVKAGRKKKK